LLLAQGDLPKLQAVFDDCDVDARGGGAKQTAIAFDQCPDDLARWLVARGADLSAADALGYTPLHRRAGSRNGRVGVLLELGANVNASGSSSGTPLHVAAGAKKAEHVAQLLAYGADVEARNDEGLTPLEFSLRGCTNIEIERMVGIARLLLESGARGTFATSKYVEEIGKRFEFHRAGFAAQHVASVSAALEALYKLFEVTPVAQRKLHDGMAPIRVNATSWQEQHAELWELLVPSSGHAATVQGEVIRIAGRIAHEVEDNGGCNWDSEFEAMARAFLAHVQTGTPLTERDLARARTLVAGLVHGAAGETSLMAELAVVWVLRNPVPTPLARPTYRL
jgi:hypothetical protein